MAGCYGPAPDASRPLAIRLHGVYRSRAGDQAGRAAAGSGAQPGRWRRRRPAATGISRLGPTDRRDEQGGRNQLGRPVPRLVAGRVEAGEQGIPQPVSGGPGRRRSPPTRGRPGGPRRRRRPATRAWPGPRQARRRAASTRTRSATAAAAADARLGDHARTRHRRRRSRRASAAPSPPRRRRGPRHRPGVAGRRRPAPASRRSATDEPVGKARRRAGGRSGRGRARTPPSRAAARWSSAPESAPTATTPGRTVRCRSISRRHAGTSPAGSIAAIWARAEPPRVATRAGSAPVARAT